MALWELQFSGDLLEEMERVKGAMGAAGATQVIPSIPR